MFAEVNGVSLHYQVSGPTPPLVVLVHEMGGTLGSWDEVVPLLPDTVGILRYDLRGFGLSEKPATGWSLDDLVGDLAGLLDHIGADAPVTLVGGAVGGGVALAFAAAHPARCRQVIGLAPATGVPPQGRPGVRALADSLEADGVRHFVMTDTAPDAYPEVLRTRPERFARFLGLQLSSVPQGYAHTMRMLAAADFDSLAPRILCPVHLVAGRHDKRRTPEVVGGYAARLTHATTETVESGHFMAVQTPEIVAGLIRSRL
ncbi:alpha/beta fold hydrolase [Gemmobacter sp.]|uniref:alpha/beta fold hydrolase n=1 Tax=Gemmobacter sp. TaxID=1898957 RepID=UPI002AFFDDDA|nr:alpha/beta fold hydrolase [Gemmobacter sp.]